MKLKSLLDFGGVLVVVLLFTSVEAIREHLGSKTPYEYVLKRNQGAINPALAAESAQHKCTYESLLVIARHGSRWPTAKYINRFEKLRQEHLLHLNWTHEFNIADEGLLTPTGEQELRSLGERVRRMYADIFEKNPDYHPKKYEFRSSQVLRALQSASSFATGMFGRSKAFAIESDSRDRDNLLRFHDNCPLYEKQKKRLTPKLDVVLERVLLKIRAKLNVSDQFTAKTLDWLWSACLFEASALDDISRACSYFDVEDAKVMEYANDVEDYWEKSHGQAINHQMACILMKDVLASLESMRNRFFFGHAETIMPVAAFLGLFKDLEHIGIDFEKEVSRQWRSGVVSPFGANIIFASKLCSPADSAPPVRYIEVRHNEQVVDMSHMCSHEGESPKMKFACTFDSFRRSLTERIGACDFAEMCGAPTNIARSNRDDTE